MKKYISPYYKILYFMYGKLPKSKANEIIMLIYSPIQLFLVTPFIGFFMGYMFGSAAGGEKLDIDHEMNSKIKDMVYKFHTDPSPEPRPVVVFPFALHFVLWVTIFININIFNIENQSEIIKMLFSYSIALMIITFGTFIVMFLLAIKNKKPNQSNTYDMYGNKVYPNPPTNNISERYEWTKIETNNNKQIQNENQKRISESRNEKSFLKEINFERSKKNF